MRSSKQRLIERNVRGPNVKKTARVFDEAGVGGAVEDPWVEGYRLAQLTCFKAGEPIQRQLRSLRSLPRSKQGMVRALQDQYDAIARVWDYLKAAATALKDPPVAREGFEVVPALTLVEGDVIIPLGWFKEYVVEKVEPSIKGDFTLTIKNAEEGHSTKSGFSRYSHVYRKIPSSITNEGKPAMTDAELRARALMSSKPLVVEMDYAHLERRVLVEMVEGKPVSDEDVENTFDLLREGGGSTCCPDVHYCNDCGTEVEYNQVEACRDAGHDVEDRPRRKNEND